MFLLLAAVCGAGPEFTVENKCPPSFTVVNRCPAPKAKPARYTNGLNCSAGFCKANGGTGCPSCPNNSGGVCACGAKAPVAYTVPTFQFQSCPTGNCPTGR